MSAATPFMYTANQLFDWISAGPDFVLLDVRNENDFNNIPYFNFMEDVQGSVEAIPKGQKVRFSVAPFSLPLRHHTAALLDF